MNIERNQSFSAAQTHAVTYDEGLRSYMLQVYNYMGSALALTGIVAWLAAHYTPLMGALYVLVEDPMDGLPYVAGMKGLGWVVAFAPLVMVMILGAGIQRMSFQAAQAAFWGFAVLMGLSLASLLLAYTGESVARVFFITAAMFGAMSLYGYVTKKDLTSIGSFCFMGVVGLIIASLVNLFLQSAALQFAISVIGVVAFVGLTAYDTQRIKQTYYAVAGHGEAMGRAAILGALNLYLDFINLFVMLLRLMGDRR